MNAFQFSIVICCIRQQISKLFIIIIYFYYFMLSKLALYKIPSCMILDKDLHNTALFK